MSDPRTAAIGTTRPLPPEMTDADYRLMVESVRDYAIFMLDPDGCIRSWNAGAQRLKGYEPADVTGRHFRLFYPPEQMTSGVPERMLHEALTHGRVEDEGWRLRKDGTRFWASVVVTALFDEKGVHRGFTKVTRDVTERREHEELLRQSEERFRLMVEGVRDYAIFMLDTQGRIASWNLGAQINKGYTAEEILGRHFSIFYPQEQLDRGWPEYELEMALRDGRFEDEGWRLRKDGSRFWAHVVITPLYDGQGDHYGYAKVTRDMSSQRRIDTLEQQERHLHQFLAMLGHELRNPLAPIANAVAIMNMGEPPNEAMRQTREILGRQVTHLCRLVDDLLDVGRIVSGKVRLERGPVKLQDVAAAAVEAVTPEIDRLRHTLRQDIATEPLWVSGDRVRLGQVLSNLLQNAAKFTPDGGQVRLILRRRDDDAELVVCDNGPGIPREKLRHVFKLFAQGEEDHASRQHGGLGIGLSLVYQMVQQHGGDVSAFSSGEPGKGAEFVVTLPLIDPP